MSKGGVHSWVEDDPGTLSGPGIKTQVIDFGLAVGSVMASSARHAAKIGRLAEIVWRRAESSGAGRRV